MKTARIKHLVAFCYTRTHHLLNALQHNNPSQNTQRAEVFARDSMLQLRSMGPERRKCHFYRHYQCTSTNSTLLPLLRVRPPWAHFHLFRPLSRTKPPTFIGHWWGVGGLATSIFRRRGSLPAAVNPAWSKAETRLGKTERNCSDVVR